MSVAAAQAASFYAEAIEGAAVWTIRDDGGFPAPKNGAGKRAMPFWSKESRALRIIKNVPAYAEFETFRIELSEFTEGWLPGLDRDGLQIGLNWSGGRAIGYDVEPNEVLDRLSVGR